jgi:Rod binding domain-containing protein
LKDLKDKESDLQTLFKDINSLFYQLDLEKMRNAEYKLILQHSQVEYNEKLN